MRLGQLCVVYLLSQTFSSPGSTRAESATHLTTGLTGPEGGQSMPKMSETNLALRNHLDIDDSEDNTDGVVTPLHSAAQLGQDKVVKLLLEKGANINVKMKYGVNPLHLAASEGHVDVVEVLVDAGANKEVLAYGRTPLHYAAANGHVDVLRALIEAGANIEAVDKHGWTPLHLAASEGHVDVVEVLVDAGANKEAVADGWTPLHFVASEGNEELVELLIEAGADIEARGNNGETPLHIAAHEGHVDVVEVLVKKGGNIESVEKKGRTPLCLAVEHSQDEIVVTLLRAGAKLNSGANDVKTIGLCMLDAKEQNGPSRKHARIEYYISQQHNVNKKFVNAITGHKTSLLETTLTDDDPYMPIAQMDAVEIESESGEKVSGVHYALKKEMWDIADYLIEKGASVKGCVGLIVTRFVNDGDVEGLRSFSQNYNESIVEELVDIPEMLKGTTFYSQTEETKAQVREALQVYSDKTLMDWYQSRIFLLSCFSSLAEFILIKIIMNWGED